jgi:chromosome segregation ATPase
VNALSKELAEMQSIIASQESKHADATNKWEDRVREYEKRLKAAAEKVKAEKQGGKERVNHLEKTVRCVLSASVTGGYLIKDIPGS